MHPSEPLERTLQAIHDALAHSLAESGVDTGPVAEMAARVLRAVESSDSLPVDYRPATLPVCAHLEPALDAASAAEPRLTTLCDALRSLAPHLAWTRRAGSARGGEVFHEGHANTWLVGAPGPEGSTGLVIGATLIAPKVRYPDHEHPPEELYLVLSEGEWWQHGGKWHSPGVGRLVHNPPGITHAMRASDSPLFAIWCLWTGKH